MQEKKNTGLVIATIIVSILLVVVLAAIIALAITQRVPSLNPATVSADATTDETVSQAQEDVTNTYDGYSIKGSDSTSSEEDSSEATETSDTYLCEQSNTEVLTEEIYNTIADSDYGDLPSGRSLAQMIINEMYARYGYQFEDESIQAYFNQKTWYTSLESYTNDMDSVYDGMSDVEKENIEFLKGIDE